MQLRPRHYALLALIVGLFVFNIVRHRHDARNVIAVPRAPIVNTPPIQSPAWAAFDHATALRDAPDGSFQPAMTSLQAAIRSAPNGDLNGCLTWLEFYRQGVNHPASDPQWKQRSERHLDSCTKFHLDTSI